MPGSTLALVVKELLVLIRAPRGIAALIVPPILQLLLFGYAATFDVNRVPIAVMNEDQGPQGRELAARFSGSPSFAVVALATREAELRRLIDEGEVVMALHLGQHFSADLAAGSLADVQILVDGRLLNTALAVQNYAGALVASFNRDYIAANGLPRPIALTVTRAWFNPNFLSHWYVVPGLIAKVLLIVTLTSAAVALTRERELGTLERLFAAPLTPLQILGAKLVPAIAVGFIQGLMMIGLAIWWFEVPFRGSVLLVGVSLAAMLLAAVGIGLMISALARTQAQAILGMFLFMVPAVMLSGFATPIASMPDWIQDLTLVNPIRWFIAILRGLFLRGSGWDFVWPQLWPILLIAGASLGVGYARIGRRLD